MKKWLKCEITKGMFSDEVTVSVKVAGGDPLAVFVPKNEVQENAKRVSVIVFEGGGKTFAMLPDESRTSVPVASADLQPA